MIRTIRAAALYPALGLALAAAAPLGAAVTSTDPSSVSAVLTGHGYKAEVAKGSDGDPIIRSASSGQSFAIFFYGCTKGRDCTSIQFYAGWKKGGSVSMSTINAWNKAHRFARAYIDGTDDPVIEMDVDLDEGGMSPALFNDNLLVWTQAMAAFDKHVNS